MIMSWSHWTLFRYIQNVGRLGESGDLCSLRFTWQRPKKSASTEETFLYDSLVQYLYLARELAGAELTDLHISKFPGKNRLFALASFANHVVAEFDMNETLPDSLPDTFFLKANYTLGHVTNQPICGHFNEEGSVLADDSGVRQLVVESCDPTMMGTTYETIQQAAKLLDTPDCDCEDLIQAVRRAVSHE